MEELKPCPKCGSGEVLQNQLFNNTHYIFEISCMRCGYSEESLRQMSFPSHKHTSEFKSLRRLWNKQGRLVHENEVSQNQEGD